MSFKDGELVWAKIKGYPYWPAKVLAKTKAPPKVLKSEHRSSDLLVRFFGKPVTYGWMLAKDLQSFIGSKADTKSPSKKLSYAIEEAIKHERQLKHGASDDSSADEDSSDSESAPEDSSQSRSEEIKPKKRGRRAKSRDETKSASKQNGTIEDKARDQRMAKREQARQQSRAAELGKKPRGRPSRASDTPVKSIKNGTVKEEKRSQSSDKNSSKPKKEKPSVSTKKVRNDKEHEHTEHNHKSASDKNSRNDKSTSPVRREEKKKPVYKMEDTAPANEQNAPTTTPAAANIVAAPANDHTPPKKRKRDSDEDDSHESKKRRRLSTSGEGKSGEVTVDKLTAYKVSLRAFLKDHNESAALRLLHKLKGCNVTLELLQKSKIGKTVKEYQTHPNKEVAQLCTEIFDSYLKLYKEVIGYNGSLEPSSSEDRKN
jgi:hypothetical protein